MRIVCVGGGPGGLYFSLMIKLRHPEYDVTVFERAPSNAGLGLSLVFWDDLSVDLWNSDPISAAMVERSAMPLRQQTVEFHEARRVTEISGYSISRQEMVNVLARRAMELGVKIVNDREIQSIGELGLVDLIVASDGVNSKTRGFCADCFHTSVAVGRNKYIWLSASKVCDGCFDFVFSETRSGLLWGAFYPIDHVSSAVVVETTSTTWKQLGFDEMGAADALRLLSKVFGQWLDGHQLRTQQSEEGLLWRSFSRLENKRWHNGKVVLLGDAAHTTHFSIGAGSTQAIKDAIALASQLDRFPNISEALLAYEHVRKTSLRRFQAEALYSARWFEEIDRYATLKPTQFLEMWELRRSPLVPRISPSLYYYLHHLTSDVPGLRAARDLVGLWARSHAVGSARVDS